MDGVRYDKRQVKTTNNSDSNTKRRLQIKPPGNNYSPKKILTRLSTRALTSETKPNTSTIDNDFESSTTNQVTTLPKRKEFSTRNSLRLAQSNHIKTVPDKSTAPTMLNQTPYDESATFRSYLGIDSSDNYVPLSNSSFTRIIGGFHYCLLCARRERLKDQFSVENHLESQSHVSNLLKLRSLLINQYPRDDSLPMYALEHLLNSWYNGNALSQMDYEQRLSVVEEFKSLIGEIDPECHCRLYGAQLDGTSLKSTSINLELIHPNSKLFDTDPKAKNSIHHKLVDPTAEYGKQFNHHVMHYDLIPNASDTLYRTAISISQGYSSFNTFTMLSSAQDLNAKVPKLVLKHQPTGLNLEVSCNANTLFRSSNLFRMYLSLDPRATTLATLVKHWTMICNISNPDQGGTLPPDAYLVLVIYFLQRTEPPVLPCLHELVTAANKTDDPQSSDDDLLTRRLKKLSVSENISAKKTNGFAEETKTERNNEQSEEVDDEDIDEDAQYADIEQEFVDNLHWQSSNISPIHRLFIDFLEFAGKELFMRDSVVSIRTLRTIYVHQKRWNTEIKAIENPIKPQVNMSRAIGSQRTYEYIRSAFKYAWYYLTSIPLDKKLRKLAEPLPDPTDFVDMYVNLGRLEFYFNIREKSMKTLKAAFDAPLEMVNQNLFCRDALVINNLIDYVVRERCSFENLPKLVARMYSDQLLVPHDKGAALFCWFCRRVGHSREKCPKARINKSASEINSYNADLDVAVSLDDGLNSMYEADRITPELTQRHKQIVAELTRIINAQIDLDCELQLFGSTVNGLGSSDSDLDICMTIKGDLTGASVDCVGILRNVQEILESNNAVQDMEAILSARVPILKFLYRQFKVDLSMYNQCAIYNSKLLRAYVLLDERVAKLVYVVKRYAKACGIADASRGSLSSYAWSLMVIHFLQQVTPPILPVLQETGDPSEKQSYGVNGWDVWFRPHVDLDEREKSNLSLTELFKYFLLFYGNYDFDTRVISIRTSRNISKFQKNWNNCMMAIEDPFELTYNLSSRLDDPMAIYIMNSFYCTYKHVVNFQEKCLERKISKPPEMMFRNLFWGVEIMGSEPPNRGCRVCHKIGHKVKDCPEMKRSRERRGFGQKNNRIRANKT